MSVKKKKLILLDTRSWILWRNKRRMNNTLVQELTFEYGVALQNNAFFSTGREHGPCSRACPHYPCSRPVFTGSVYRPATTIYSNVL